MLDGVNLNEINLNDEAALASDVRAKEEDTSSKRSYADATKSEWVTVSRRLNTSKEKKPRLIPTRTSCSTSKYKPHPTKNSRAGAKKRYTNKSKSRKSTSSRWRRNA